MTADGPIQEKFVVSRADGKDTDPDSKHFGGCSYFVLDLDHDPHAVTAWARYAAVCRYTHPKLSKAIKSDLVERGHRSTVAMEFRNVGTQVRLDDPDPARPEEYSPEREAWADRRDL